MPDRPWTELLALYPEGHLMRSAIRWADLPTVPVLAGVLVEEVERLTLALGARNTESDSIWLEECSRLNRSIDMLNVELDRQHTALRACWDEYHELMPDDLHEQVKTALGIREFEARLDG